MGKGCCVERIVTVRWRRLRRCHRGRRKPGHQQMRRRHKERWLSGRGRRGRSFVCGMRREERRREERRREEWRREERRRWRGSRESGQRERPPRFPAAARSRASTPLAIVAPILITARVPISASVPISSAGSPPAVKVPAVAAAQITAMIPMGEPTPATSSPV
jgi:hypothetical protein